VCLWGQSMGGQLAISAAAMMENTEIRAVVAEATYSSYKLQIKDKVAAMGALWLIQWGAWLFTNDELSAQEVVGNLHPTKLLLVHGAEDNVVLPYHSESLYASAGTAKEIWRVDSAGHLQVFDSSEYRAKLVTFFHRSLQDGNFSE